MSIFNEKAGTRMPASSTSFATKSMLRNLLCAHIGLLAFLATASQVMAQNIQPVDVAEFWHGTSYMGMSGDTLKFQFTLGIEEVPVAEAVGYELEFAFPKLEATPDTIIVDVDSTWIAEGLTNPAPLWSFDTGDNVLITAFLRSDQDGVTGYGKVANLYLIREGGFSSSEAAIYLDGGVVMIDNINLRIAQGTPKPFVSANQSSAAAPATIDADDQGHDPGAGFSVYPNPASDYVDVVVADPKGCTLRLWSLEAALIQTMACEAKQRIDLEHLPSGNYLITLDSPKRSAQRLIVRR